MKSITPSNDNPITTEVVKNARKKESAKKEAEKKFDEETASVVDVVARGQRLLKTPNLYRQDAMVEIIARIPGEVAAVAVTSRKNQDEGYPILTAFGAGMALGMVILAAIVILLRGGGHLV